MLGQLLIIYSDHALPLQTTAPQKPVPPEIQQVFIITFQELMAAKNTGFDCYPLPRVFALSLAKNEIYTRFGATQKDAMSANHWHLRYSPISA